MVCYDVYRLSVSGADSSSTVLSVGPLLPTLVDSTIQVLQLPQVDGLQANLPFSLQITAVHDDGERAFNDRVTFSK